MKKGGAGGGGGGPTPLTMSLADLGRSAKDIVRGAAPPLRPLSCMIATTSSGPFITTEPRRPLWLLWDNPGPPAHFVPARAARPPCPRPVHSSGCAGERVAQPWDARARGHRPDAPQGCRGRPVGPHQPGAGEGRGWGRTRGRVRGGAALHLWRCARPSGPWPGAWESARRRLRCAARDGPVPVLTAASHCSHAGPAGRPGRGAASLPRGQARGHGLWPRHSHPPHPVSPPAPPPSPSPSPPRPHPRAAAPPPPPEVLDRCCPPPPEVLARCCPPLPEVPDRCCPPP